MKKVLKNSSLEMALDCKVYVGNLPDDASEEELERSFSYYGPLQKIWVARNPPGFGFVEYQSSTDADEAVKGLNGKTVCGMQVKVQKSSGKIRPKPWVKQRQALTDIDPDAKYGPPVYGYMSNTSLTNGHRQNGDSSRHSTSTRDHNSRSRSKSRSRSRSRSGCKCLCTCGRGRRSRLDRHGSGSKHTRKRRSRSGSSEYRHHHHGYYSRSRSRSYSRSSSRGSHKRRYTRFSRSRSSGSSRSSRSRYRSYSRESRSRSRPRKHHHHKKHSRSRSRSRKN